MAQPVKGINPLVLRWARESLGYTTNDVAKTLKRSIEVVEGWESGNLAPTYAQLERLAYQVYKRPIALFFFPEPPAEKNVVTELRTLPEFEIAKLSADTRYAFRQAQAMQVALRELNDGKNPGSHQIQRDVSIHNDIQPRELAGVVREYLGITLLTQTSWKNTEVALKRWRDLIQDKGIFVFKRSLKQREISGFCLVDEEFPVIFLNNSNTDTRQIFSLFHELAHILLQANGVTKLDDRYISDLPKSLRHIELFANQFAAECIVPHHDFIKQLGQGPFDDPLYASLANRYSVSREVILRRVLDLGLIDHTQYETKVAEWALPSDKVKGKGKGKGGGDYYANQATYLGDRYLKLVFGRYYQGHFGIEQLADYLNIKVQSVSGLEQFIVHKATI